MGSGRPPRDFKSVDSGLVPGMVGSIPTRFRQSGVICHRGRIQCRLAARLPHGSDFLRRLIPDHEIGFHAGRSRRRLRRFRGRPHGARAARHDPVAGRRNSMPAPPSAESPRSAISRRNRADYRDFPEHLDARLRDAYRRRGVEQLYSPPARGARPGRSGGERRRGHPRPPPARRFATTRRSSTGSSGSPTPARSTSSPPRRSPRTRRRRILQLKDLLGEDVRADVYDGDTPGDARRSIRTRAHIVVTNPDMLHAGILPHHTKWAKLFENLRFVVIDEMHTYRGVFGSHLANLLRRLRRVCAHYGADPRFILSSATIANPRELAEGLTERPIALVDRSGAPPAGTLLPVLQPPGGERGTRDPPLGARRDAPDRGGFPEGRPADDRVRPLPNPDRGARQVPEAGHRDPS